MGATSETPAEGAILEARVAEDLSDRMLIGWNRHDADALLAVMTEDVSYEDSSWPKTMHGKFEVREFLQATWRAVPDLTFEFETAIPGPRMQVINYWRATATQTGVWDPPGLDATGNRFVFEGAFFGEVRDGKLSRIKVVYDVAAILRQVGVLPEQGSRAEKATIALANLRTRLRKRLDGSHPA